MPVLKPHPVSPRAAVRVRAPIDDRLDQHLFKALGDPTRLLVLSCLVKCGRAVSVSEVAGCCEVDFSVVNKHMKILESAGVLGAEKRGRRVWYTARCGDLCDRLSALIDAIAEWCPNLESPSDRRPGASCCGASGGEDAR